MKRRRGSDEPLTRAQARRKTITQRARLISGPLWFEFGGSAPSFPQELLDLCDEVLIAERRGDYAQRLEEIRHRVDGHSFALIPNLLRHRAAIQRLREIEEFFGIRWARGPVILALLDRRPHVIREATRSAYREALIYGYLYASERTQAEADKPRGG